MYTPKYTNTITPSDNKASCECVRYSQPSCIETLAVIFPAKHSYLLLHKRRRQHLGHLKKNLCKIMAIESVYLLLVNSVGLFRSLFCVETHAIDRIFSLLPIVKGRDLNSGNRNKH